MSTTKNSIFLLGGHDLEMIEIKKLLERYGCQFHDAGLRWDNAELDAYRDVLEQNPDASFIGIELRDPGHLSTKFNYTLIDHHNELSDRPAAILQVAAMLGVEPNRRLLLVAANDSGYIPAMQAIGATEEEMAAIRKEDRAAQGVSDEDELLAQLSIANHLSKHGNLLVVHALTSCFSPICDRLFPYRHLLVYTDSEWVFYGSGKDALVKSFSKEISAGQIYHGGGKSGFIGAARGVFPPQDINSFVKSITRQYERP